MPVTIKRKESVEPIYEIVTIGKRSVDVKLVLTEVWYPPERALTLYIDRRSELYITKSSAIELGKALIEWGEQNAD